MNAFRINSALIFLWIGFVCAISFMEAWLKFQAPGISLGLGLGIGKLVFGMLDKIEWLFAVIILFYLIQSKQIITHKSNFILLVPFLILAVQSFWLLPSLNLRADLIIEGKNPPASSLHFYYVGLEIVKIVCLAYLGVRYLKALK